MGDGDVEITTRETRLMMQILVDADACPVVDIVELIAEKYNIPTTLLCDTNHVLFSDYSKVIVVGAGADAVDYKLISICHKGDVVVSQDYGVAAMALGKGAYAIHQSGKWYTNENIDQMLMERHLNKKARRSSHKSHMKGPRKRTEEDDVRFAQSFEKLILRAKAEENNKKLKCYLLVNHDEQITVYEQIAEKLGLTEKYGKVVSKPTTFINNHSENDPVDVAFVDEAHLLLTQGKQSYRGENQLKDIIDRARVTVVMFDENQILTTEQFWESQILEQYRNYAKITNNHIVLDKQLRMQVDSATMDWIDSFTKKGQLKKIPDTFGSYTIKIFDKPELLDMEIQKRAKDSDSALSRVIATYDWEYSSKRKPEERIMKYWEVFIGKWHKPWNRELESELTRKEKRDIKGLAWAEQPQTINEVGSTFTIQGFDLNYAGVILGPSVKYRDGKIIFDPSESHNEKAIRNRTLSDGTKQKFGEILIQHEVRVLMTRGVNGMYIYACDPELQAALLEAAR